MTPTNKLLRKELTGVDSCSSSSSSSSSSTPPASTSIDQRYSMLTADVGSSGRAIDRFSPHLCDPLRAKSFNREVLSQSPSKPKPYNSPMGRRRSSTCCYGSTTHHGQQQQQLIISPATSARYLLTESTLISSKEEDLWDSVPSAWRLLQSSAKLQESTNTPSSSTVTGGPQNQQVVVLWVSLHCKGCEEKVRKHISKMEGVTSFTTDLENKKVTVVGDVTPLGVLNSISKVKNAQLWRSSLPSTSS